MAYNGKPRQNKTARQMIQERIDRGEATCACSALAVKIKDGQPVCDGICGGGVKRGASAAQQNKPVGRRVVNAYAGI